jgi:sensor histidine kinase regulating citrate/malate metabolism
MKNKNANIGIGLACSKEICNKIGGDIKLKHSQKGLTVFSFKIPIEILSNENDDIL